MKTILHILTNAHLGGCERNCEMYISASTNYQHRIIIQGDSGPMSAIWKSQGAEIEHLNQLESNRSLLSSLKRISDEDNYSAILYWSTAKMPLVRAAFKRQPCTFAVHIGNPIAISLLSTIKFYLIHLLLHSKQRTVLFCCSQHVQKSVFENFFFKKFNSIVVHNPVKILTHNPYIARTLTPTDVVILGMTARLDSIKDHDTVIRAFAQVLKTYPNAQLWLMGDGELRATLEQLCCELKIQNNVIFHGNVPNVYDYLPKLDLFVYATTMSEGFGNVVAEAMANGLPCVISDLPMMREVAGDGKTVNYFTSLDELVSTVLFLIENTDSRMKKSKESFFRANVHFSSEKYVKEMQQITGKCKG